MGISLRLDAFPCDSDRHHCGRRSRIRTLQRRASPMDFRKQLHYFADSVWRIRTIAFDGTARRPGAHWIFDIYEHAWLGSRQAYPKRFYDRKNWRAARVDRPWNRYRTEIRCRCGKLQRLLDCARQSWRLRSWSRRSVAITG